MPETADTFTQLAELVAALDRRFPAHNGPFERVSRLAEEAGELAGAVNHAEGMGVKNQKHGTPDLKNLVKEVEDVLRSAIGIAHHYGVLGQVRDSIAHHHDSYRDQGYIPSHEHAG
jgi:NTP pyrophosphatase (non-canonical NTP hydrolase)